MKPKLSVCFCAWNEEDNIALCIDDALKHLPQVVGENSDFEVIVIDNASTDSTPDIVNKYHAKDARVQLISHSENRMYSGSYMTAMKRSKGEYVALVDGDFQYTTANLAEFIEFAEKQQCDVVFGWRKERNDPFSRKIISWGLKVLSQNIIGHRFEDINCGYRLASRKAANAIELTERINIAGPEMYCECRKNNLTMGELPTRHFAREHGAGLFNSLGKLTNAVLNFHRYLKRLKKRYGNRPVLEVKRRG